MAALALLSLAAACGGQGPPASSLRAQLTLQPYPGRRVAATAESQRDCLPSPTVVCLRDTAIAGREPNELGEYPTARWVWFASAGDSVDIVLVPGGGTITTNLGQLHAASGVTAWYFATRVATDRVIDISVAMDEMLGDTVPYTLRIARVPHQRPDLRATGRFTRLTVVAAAIDKVSIIPASVQSRVRDAGPWEVYPRTYNVALVTDSVYRICRDPCTAPHWVKLVPGGHVIVRP